MWVRADVALIANDVNAAHAIYRLLSDRKPNTPYEFLFVGLAAYRLQNIARAIDILDEGQRRYPSMPSLVDNFLRISIEQGQIDRPLRSMDPQVGKAACERLIAQTVDWNTQVSLVVYCVRAGLWEFANTRIDEIIRACDNTAAIWRLSDILLRLGRKGDADRIYQKLSGRAADSPQSALYAALSFERLGAAEKAAERLEAELSKFPNAQSLRDHFQRICFGTGQIQRIARFLDRGGSDPAAIETLFEKFPDASHQLKLLEYCLDKGDISLVKRRVSREPGGGRYENGTIWNVALLMDAKGFAADARDVFETLVNCPRNRSLDAYYAAAAALRLGDGELCLTILEDGQRAYPTAAELRSFYLQICASRVDYERYATFMKAFGIEARGIQSIADFYRAAVDGRSSETFVMNYKEIQRACPPDSFAALKHDVLDALKKVTLPSDKARPLVFFSRYLDLDQDFSSAMWDVLRDQAKSNVAAGATAETDQHALEMLFQLTPPMVPAEGGRSEEMVRQFVGACHSLARQSIELVEPIGDMSANWTPWQYLFCSGAIHEYSAAIAALESIAFKTWPKLGHTARHVSDDRRRAAPSRRIRIGFIVHDSMPMMSGLLSGLDLRVFETVFLRPGKMGRSRAAKDWVLRAERTVEFSDRDTFAAIDTIAAEQLDIIVSGPSVASVFFPMMARLAHLQMVLLEPNWTDGLSNADYYVSWRPAEPEEPKEFYRSKVALLEHPPYYIERHAVDEISDDAKLELRRRLLGLGPDDRAYLCANTPPKIHPDMDEMFRRLLESDPQGTLVILRAEYPPTKTLKSRLHRKLGKLAERIIFLPTLKQEDAHRLLLSVDCCLDSFPLCGMSSSFDAAMIGVPIVTLPTPIPFGKWTATIYDYICVPGLTAKDKDEYLQIALRLAKDPAWRNKMGAQLRRKAKRFVESTASVGEFADFITHAWDRHLAGLPPADWIGDGWRPPAASAGSNRQSAASLDEQKAVALS